MTTRPARRRKAPTFVQTELGFTTEMAARDRGTADATAHAGDDTAAIVRRWALAIADDVGDDGFTSDDVRLKLPAWTAAKVDAAYNVMGSVFQSLAKARLIERAPDKAPRTARHSGARGRRLTVWRKLQGGA